MLGWIPHMCIAGVSKGYLYHIRYYSAYTIIMFFLPGNVAVHATAISAPDDLVLLHWNSAVF